MGYLWNEDMRECQYAACDVLVLHETLNKDKAESLTSAVKELVVSKSWWDTVDYLASVIGNTLIHEGMLNVMDGWIKDDSIWVRRVAIICQNKRKTKTDAKRLFQYCKEHASDTEFFIAKAIGWSLRSYAYTDPDAVQRFVEETNGLQNLSKREALKNIVKKKIFKKKKNVKNSRKKKRIETCKSLKLMGHSETG
mmetsp:Transcript_23688/g.33164  ORF Transcript_23688/g.33164 Transcript_23688/m.33164 type:complete len:195 (-) Transcript_23688:173-757(-)